MSYNSNRYGDQNLAWQGRSCCSCPHAVRSRGVICCPYSVCIMSRSELNDMRWAEARRRGQDFPDWL